MTMDELLENADWASKLARSLVRDQAQADDLVQDLWRIALERSSRQVSAPRAYLATIMRRLVGQESRRDQRRRLAEVEKAREIVEHGADSEAKLETMKSLVAALDALPTDYRRLLLLRYFEGLENPEIGQRLGLAPATLRTRMKRARDLLREELDRRSRRDGVSWCLPLIPLALDNLAWSSGLSTVSVAKGVLTMSMPAKLAIATVVAALGLWLWQAEKENPGQLESLTRSQEEVAVLQPRRESPGEKPPVLEKERDRVTREVVARDEALADAAEDAAGDELGPAKLFRLSGRILDRSGSPLEEVLVRLFSSNTSDFVKATRSAEGGRFEIEGLAADEDFVFEARTLSTGRRLMRIRLQGDRDLGDVRLGGDGRLRGRIQDANGLPQSDIELQVLPERLLGKSWHQPLYKVLPATEAVEGVSGLEDAVILSDSEGRFEVSGLVPGRYFFVSDEEVILREADLSFATGEAEIELTVQADRLVVELESEEDFNPDEVLVRVLSFLPGSDPSALKSEQAESQMDSSGDEDLLSFFVDRHCPVLVAASYKGALTEELVLPEKDVDPRRVKLRLASPELGCKLTLHAQSTGGDQVSGAILVLRAPRSDVEVLPFNGVEADKEGIWQNLPRGLFRAEFEIPAGPWGEASVVQSLVQLDPKEVCVVNLILLKSARLQVKLKSKTAQDLPVNCRLEARNRDSDLSYQMYRFVEQGGRDPLPLRLNQDMPWPVALPPGRYEIQLVVEDEILATERIELAEAADRKIELELD